MKSLYGWRRLLWPFLFLAIPNMVLSQFGEKIGDEWEQVSPNISFQRNADWNEQDGGDGPMDEAMRRMLGGQGNTNSPYSYSMQSTGKEWNSYQLAWRLLGFYVDCNYKGDDSTCQRLVLYAVYVDPDYSGNGLSEYEFYDASSGQFVCHNYYGNCRAKMDCHLSSTSWQLMGIFKIASISAGNGWMEQLFKHEGVCVWGEDTYKFASKMREKIPSGCSKSKYTDKQGNYLYYDAKPEPNAKIGVGLYTDSKCSLEYGGSDVSVYTVTGYSEDYFDTFNEALDTWKVCQPCVAYNLNYAYNNFYCYDEAGYENCNQCMKFSAKSYCETASSRDVTLAERQQTLVPFQMYGSSLGGSSYSNGASSTSSSIIRKATPVDTTNYEKSFPFMTCSMLFFTFSLIMFGLIGPWKVDVRKRRRRKEKQGRHDNDEDNNNDGLVRDNGAVELPAIIASISRSFSKGSEVAVAQAAELRYQSKSVNEANAGNNEEPLIDFHLFNVGVPSDAASSNKMGQKLAGIIATISNTFSSKDNAEERSPSATKFVSEGGAFSTSQEKKQPLLHEMDIESTPSQFDRGLTGTYGLEPPVYQIASHVTSLPANYLESVQVSQEILASETTVIPKDETKREVEDSKDPDPPGAELFAPDGEELFSSSQSVSPPSDDVLESKVDAIDDSSSPNANETDSSEYPHQTDATGVPDASSVGDVLDKESPPVDGNDAQGPSTPVVDGLTFEAPTSQNEILSHSGEKACTEEDIPTTDYSAFLEDVDIDGSGERAFTDDAIPTTDYSAFLEDEDVDGTNKEASIAGVDSEATLSSTQGIDRYESLDNEDDAVPPLVNDDVHGGEVAVVGTESTPTDVDGPKRYDVEVNVADEITPPVHEEAARNDEETTKDSPNTDGVGDEVDDKTPVLDTIDRAGRLQVDPPAVFDRAGNLQVDPPAVYLEGDYTGGPAGSDSFTYDSEHCVDGDSELLIQNDPVATRAFEAETTRMEREDVAFLMDETPFDELRDHLLSDPISMDREEGSSYGDHVDDDDDDDGEVVDDSEPSSPATGSGAASMATGIDNFLLDTDHFGMEGETQVGIIDSISLRPSHVNDILSQVGVDDDEEEKATELKQPPVSRAMLATTVAVDGLARDPPASSELPKGRAYSQLDDDDDEDDLSEANREALGDEETVSTYSSNEFNVDSSTLATVSQFIDLVHQKSHDELDLAADNNDETTTTSEVPDDEVLVKLGLLDIKHQFSDGAGKS